MQNAKQKSEYWAPVIIYLDLENPYWGEEIFVIEKGISKTRFQLDKQPTLYYGLTDPYDSEFIIITSGKTFDYMDYSSGTYAFLDV